MLLSTLAPQQPSSVWPLTAGCCSLQAGWGSWPRCVRMSPQTAGRRWLLGGTCSSSLCLLSAKAPPPVVTQPAGLVRACETFSWPLPDPKAEPSCQASSLHPVRTQPMLARSTRSHAHETTCSGKQRPRTAAFLKIWVEHSSPGSEHTEATTGRLGQLCPIAVGYHIGIHKVKHRSSTTRQRSGKEVPGGHLLHASLPPRTSDLHGPFLLDPLCTL